MDEDQELEAFFREADERQFNCDVQNELTLYRATGDARFVWRAIALFAEARKPLPLPLVDKLAQWAERVQAVQKPSELVTALELSGAGRHKVGPSHSAAFERRWMLASRVLTVRKHRPALTLGAAIAMVARNEGQSVASVKKAYHSTFTKKRGADVDGAADLAAVMSHWR